MLYQLLDVFFLVFHTSLTLFNAVGWMWKSLRKINLATLFLTGASWFGLGIFYGIGYCPFTDWHFRVLRNLGETNIPDSYLQYLAYRFCNLKVSSTTMDLITGTVFFLAFLASLIFNVRDYKQKKKSL